MGIEVYLGRHFQHGHERRAFGAFLKDLVARFGEHEDLFMVIAEVDANSAAMDLLLLTPRCILIADLKQLTAASEQDAPGIRLEGKENGQWSYYLPGDSSPRSLGGGASRGKNPYKQMEQMRYRFADWLVDHSKDITGERWERARALERLRAWVVISPGFDGRLDGLDLPWEGIAENHAWFRVLPLDQLAWEFNCATMLHFEMTERQMRGLVEQLGATRLAHLGSVWPEGFPEDLPAPPSSFLFSAPRAPRRLVGRDADLKTLTTHLEDPAAAIVCLKGLGGVGKSELAGAATAALQKKGWQVRWVECREKDLTLEMLLAAVAAEVEDGAVARAIVEKDREQVSLFDRLELALHHLEQRRTLLVLEDLHRVSRQEELEKLFVRAALRAGNFRLLLTSRDHPRGLDSPKLPPGSVREVALYGLGRERVPEYFGACGTPGLDAAQADLVWERTQGNPYAMSLIHTLARRAGWGDLLRSLPLYTNDHDHWFDSLMETLSEDARQLAARLAVLRSGVSLEMIGFLWHQPTEALLLAGQLRDSFVLQPVNQAEDAFQMHEFLREYLYSRLPDNRRLKAHLDAGRFFQRSAQDGGGAEAHFEALCHFEKAEAWAEAGQASAPAYEALRRCGDWSRAYEASEIALKAARSRKSPLEAALWLTRLAEWECDQGRADAAGRHLQQALEQMPRPGARTSPGAQPEIEKVRARISMERGRLAYHISDFDQASLHLENALQAARSLGDDLLAADCLMRIGRVERQRARMDSARRYFEEVRGLAARLGDSALLVQAESHLGLIARQEGDLEAARQSFTRARDYAARAGDSRSEEINRSLLGDLARRQGRHAEAAAIFRQCLEYSRRAGSGIAQRINLGQLAESLIRLGELEEGERLLDEVEGLCAAAQDGIGAAWALRRRGLLLKQRGDPAGGDAWIQKGIEKLVEIDSQVYIEDFRRDLGDAQLPLPGV